MTVLEVKFMVMAADMERATAFYRDTIGLTVKFSSPYWTELTFGDAVVALHGGGEGAEQETGLGFVVDDIHAACQQLVAGGGRVVMDPEAREQEGIMLASVADPEGNLFSLSQSLA
jgi:predicted enzyme related to lactoylglutathione lyase